MRSRRFGYPGPLMGESLHELLAAFMLISTTDPTGSFLRCHVKLHRNSIIV